VLLAILIVAALGAYIGSHDRRRLPPDEEGLAF